MDVAGFIKDLESELSRIPYVISIESIPVSNHSSIKRNICLKHRYRLNIFFNEISMTISFSLIEKNKRIWGLDKDYKHGWHIHPLDNIQVHESIEQKSVKQIIKIFDKIYRKLIFKRFNISIVF